MDHNLKREIDDAVQRRDGGKLLRIADTLLDSPLDDDETMFMSFRAAGHAYLIFGSEPNLGNAYLRAATGDLSDDVVQTISTYLGEMNRNAVLAIGRYKSRGGAPQPLPQAPPIPAAAPPREPHYQPVQTDNSKTILLSVAIIAGVVLFATALIVWVISSTPGDNPTISQPQKQQKYSMRYQGHPVQVSHVVFHVDEASAYLGMPKHEIPRKVIHQAQSSRVRGMTSYTKRQNTKRDTYVFLEDKLLAVYNRQEGNEKQLDLVDWGNKITSPSKLVEKVDNDLMLSETHKWEDKSVGIQLLKRRTEYRAIDKVTVEYLIQPLGTDVKLVDFWEEKDDLLSMANMKAMERKKTIDPWPKPPAPGERLRPPAPGAVKRSGAFYVKNDTWYADYDKFVASSSFKKMVSQAKQEARKLGVELTTREIKALFLPEESRQIYHDKMIDVISPAQPEKRSKKLRSIYDILMSETRQSEGLSIAAKHGDALQRAYERFGVSPEDLISLLNIESEFGKYRGDYDVFRIFLSETLFIEQAEKENRRRGAYRQKNARSRRSNLKRVSKIKKRGIKNMGSLLAHSKKLNADPRAVKGSFSGAIGICQFLPYNLNYGVDGNGDGIVDLNNMEDAIFSTANYLVENGYKKSKEKAFYRYNRNREYVRAVKDFAQIMRRRM